MSFPLPDQPFRHSPPPPLTLQNPMRIRMANWVKSLQDHIVQTIESIEALEPVDSSTSTSLGHDAPLSTSSHPIGDAGPAKFHRDHWIRPSGGEGSSCALTGGRVFEKAGVLVSIIHGHLPTSAQRAMKTQHASLPISDEPVPFFVTGLSLIIHPRNPHIPTVHLNYRYFEIEDPSNPGVPIAWWFGGGSDLTPTYLVNEDARHFHQTLKDACDIHNEAFYKTWKPDCDKYFYIPHRAESRGVGGIFFDDLTESSKIHTAGGDGKPKSQAEIFDIVKTLSSSFLPSYIPIVLRNKDKGWTEQEKRWQLLRRGRYVEFNLVYDRGTKFGLATPGARIESILMSLPETARWEYQTDLGGEGTKEDELLQVLRTPKEWAK
jgi:coproporphyrinogen III oxidase